MSQSHTHGTFPGPALHTLSGNIKQKLLANLCSQHGVDIVCLQETHRGLSRPSNSSGRVSRIPHVLTSAAPAGRRKLLVADRRVVLCF